MIYLAMYSTEICVISALFLGVAIGFWRGHDHGLDKGYDKGFKSGFKWGDKIAKMDMPKRDAKGRYTKCS